MKGVKAQKGTTKCVPMCTPCADFHESKKLICENCGGMIVDGRCRDCDLPVGTKVDKSKPLCSTCRRRHGSEVQHPTCE